MCIICHNAIKTIKQNLSFILWLSLSLASRSSLADWYIVTLQGRMQPTIVEGTHSSYKMAYRLELPLAISLYVNLAIPHVVTSVTLAFQKQPIPIS